MRGNPLLRRQIVLERAMFPGTMRRFADKPDRQLAAAIMGYAKSDCVAGAFCRQPGTGGRVAEIAKLAKMIVFRFGAFVTGSGTMAPPASA